MLLPSHCHLFDSCSRSVLPGWCLLLSFSCLQTVLIFIRCITHHQRTSCHTLRYISKGLSGTCLRLVLSIRVCVCVREKDEILNDPTSTLFQVGLCHSHICSQGHKFTDREVSGAARLLRLHCYCMWHDTSAKSVLYKCDIEAHPHCTNYRFMWQMNT